jgi:hypothetical protein
MKNMYFYRRKDKQRSDCDVELYGKVIKRDSFFGGLRKHSIFMYFYRDKECTDLFGYSITRLMQSSVVKFENGPLAYVDVVDNGVRKVEIVGKKYFKYLSFLLILIMTSCSDINNNPEIKATNSFRRVSKVYNQGLKVDTIEIHGNKHEMIVSGNSRGNIYSHSPECWCIKK